MGVIISRRYYARSLGARQARTALLPDDGALPAVASLATDSESADPYEAEIARPAEATFLESGRRVPSAGSPPAAAGPQAPPTD